MQLAKAAGGRGHESTDKRSRSVRYTDIWWELMQMQMNTSDLESPNETIYSRQAIFGAPAGVRPGLALALSGGGFRASLFHLGALRCLNEHGILSRISTISSVSGGSILAAHIAEKVDPWPEPGNAYPRWEESVSRPFREFTGRNIRTWPILRRYLPPWNVFRSNIQASALAAHYAKLNPKNVSQLPAAPRFIFCATDMIFGVNWVFERERVGDYEAGYGDPGVITIAEAVTASSSFPPVFPPVRIGTRVRLTKTGRLPRGRQRDHYLKHLSLTDGGVYDNMGLEPVWRNHGVVLVSDGGAIFRFQLDKSPLRRLVRYSSILGDQAGRLRRRWLISKFNDGSLHGTFWSISSLVSNYDAGAEGYGTEVTKEFIARIRTDLDAFSELEAKILENHGFFLADVAIRTHVPWLATVTRPLAPPHPELMSDNRAKSALGRSSIRRWIGRF